MKLNSAIARAMRLNWRTQLNSMIVKRKITSFENDNENKKRLSTRFNLFDGRICCQKDCFHPKFERVGGDSFSNLGSKGG